MMRHGVRNRRNCRIVCVVLDLFDRLWEDTTSRGEFGLELDEKIDLGEG